MKKIIVAIDGYSGTGKSSTARAVAEKLQYAYIDTGAMYRSVTLFLQRNKLDKNDQEQSVNALDQLELRFKFNSESGFSEIFLNGENVEREIRSTEISDHVSEIAAIKEVRRKMVSLQQEMGKTKELVMDGRDIGTVVFPEAELKIFMTAKPEVRAERRLLELREKNIDSTFSDVLSNLLERDRKDTTRADSPLIKAKDAVEVDTTQMTFDEQVNKIVKLAEGIINEY